MDECYFNQLELTMKKELRAYLKFLFISALTFFLAVLMYDLVRHGWIDLRSENMLRLFFVPWVQALALSVITYRLRNT